MPGPSLLLIAGASVQRGWRAGAAVTLGVVLADAILLLMVLGGLGTLAETAPTALSWLKWLGAAYLLYLGATQLRMAGAGGVANGRGGFRRGLATTLLNPKSSSSWHCPFRSSSSRARTRDGRCYCWGRCSC